MKKLIVLAAAASSMLIYSCQSDAPAGSWTQAQVDSLKQNIVDSVVAAKNHEHDSLMNEYNTRLADSLRIVDSIAKATGRMPTTPVVVNKGSGSGKPSTNNKPEPTAPAKETPKEVGNGKPSMKNDDGTVGSGKPSMKNKEEGKVGEGKPSMKNK